MKTTIAHDEAAAWLLASRKKVTLRQASDAFLASLSTNEPAWRSALPAFAIAAHFEEHRHHPTQTYSGESCGVCGMKPIETYDPAWSERSLAWECAPFDIALRLDALGARHPKPTAADLEIMNGILRLIRAVQSTATDGKARRGEVEKGIAPLLPRTNKDERRAVLDVLGFCSLLETEQHRGFFESFQTYDARGHGAGDAHSSFGSWTARDGINVRAQRHFFPQRSVEAIEIAPPPVASRAAKPSRALGDAHPLLAAAFDGLSAEDRAKLPPAHLGGPRPNVDNKALLRLASRWLADIAPDIPKASRALYQRALKKGSGGYIELVRDEHPVASAAGWLVDARDRTQPLGTLRGAARLLAGGLGLRFAAKVDADLLCAEVEQATKQVLPAEARVVFRAPKEKLWIVKLTEKRWVFAGQLGRTPTWHVGDRDEVLAMVPDGAFEAAVTAVRG